MVIHQRINQSQVGCKSLSSPGSGDGWPPWISPLICPNGFPSLDTKHSHPKLRFRRGIYVYIPCFSHHLHWMYRYRLFIKMTCDKSAFKQLEVSFVHFFLVTACHECFQCTSMNGRFIHIDDAHFDNFPSQFNIVSRSNARKIEPEKAWKKSSLWAINPGFENLISLIAKKMLKYLTT